MKVVGKPILQALKDGHADSRGQCDAWLSEVEEAKWQTTQAIKNRYASVSFLANNIVVFNIKGNRYRVVAKVAYNNGIVKIEFAGTHADYTRLYS